MRRTLALLVTATLSLVVATGTDATDPALAPAPPAAPAADGDIAPVPGEAPPEAPVGPPAIAAGGGAEDQVAATDVGGPSPTDPDPRAAEDGPVGLLVVAGGRSSAGTGPLLRYSVEVEVATGLDPDTVAATVDAALGDPRSWARERRLERVDDVALADARVVVATPATVDALCARAGLDTAGVFSCWTGDVAALNAWRWEVGATGFPDLVTYRTYLVNHEVGHALGYDHRRCPEPGAVAPVMMQQSKDLGGCIANGWPYP